MRSLLEKVTILAGLKTEALDLLWADATETRITGSGVIVREGEPGNSFFLLGEGAVRVCKNFGQPEEVELVRLGAGDFFGEMCILECMPRAATVQGIGDITLLSLSSMAFYHLYERMPGQHSILVVNIARDLSRRLRRLDEIFAGRH
jgi:CRP-like cAMP-binding protein